MSSAVSQTKSSMVKARRRKLLAAINITWKQLRPDLSTAEELREARLDFAAAELKTAPIGSFSHLTTYQLGKVLEAMQREQAQPRLQGCEIIEVRPREPQATSEPTGEVLHLCSKKQSWLIGRIMDYLGWADDRRQSFLSEKFKRGKEQMLSPRQAHSAIRILMNYAAWRDIKNRKRAEGIYEPVTKEMIDREIPALKRRLGLEVR